jgi:hypothetical protein
VLALAPDPGSAKAARGLTDPRTWSDLGSNESLVWGKCQGSARAPYQVTVDLNEPAFRCTCPSRKFPCKHGLALLLMWAAGDGVVADMANAEAFAADWAEARADRKAPATERTPDPEAQAKRLAERESLMSAGIDDFERWLHDVVRQGLAGARRQPPTFWDTAAARLVDAQLPGLGERVRAMGGDVHARADWAPHLLAALGRWYLVVRAWRRRASLDAAAMGDLRTVLGWSRRSAEVLAGERLADRWWVLGVSEEEDERQLLSQRTWLYGERTGELVVLLDFAAAGAALKVPQVLGSVVDAEVALYPGSALRRALLVGEEHKVTQGDGLPGATDVRGALAKAAEWLAGNPWLSRLPMALTDMTVVPGDTPLVVDRTGAALALAPETDVWHLLALSGGHPIPVFGEWMSERFHPLSAEIDGRLVTL